MSNYEKFENTPLENDLKKISINAFSQNPDFTLLFGDNIDLSEPTKAILMGIYSYGDASDERCDVQIINFYDVDNGDRFIYLVDDNCFYLNNEGLFNVDDNEKKVSENDLIIFIDLISKTQWMSIDAQDLYGEQMDN